MNQSRRSFLTRCLIAIGVLQAVRPSLASSKLSHGHLLTEQIDLAAPWKVTPLVLESRTITLPMPKCSMTIILHAQAPMDVIRVFISNMPSEMTPTEIVFDKAGDSVVLDYTPLEGWRIERQSWPLAPSI